MNAQPAKLPKTVSPVSLLQISYFGSLRSFDLFSLPSWLRNGIGPLPCLEGPLACGVMEYIYTGSTSTRTNTNHQDYLGRQFLGVWDMRVTSLR